MAYEHVALETQVQLSKCSESICASNKEEDQPMLKRQSKTKRNKNQPHGADWGRSKIIARVLTCILVLGSTAVAGRKKTADDLDVQSSAWVNVIVQYADGPSATHANKAKN